VNRHIHYTLALMCAKFRVNILGSFLDISQNAEWPRFLAHPVCACFSSSTLTGSCIVSKTISYNFTFNILAL